MKRWWLVPMLAVWILPVQAAPSRAELLAAPCLSCHGSETAARNEIPRLELEAGVIRARLEAFRKDDSHTTVMTRIARGYTDEEIALIAEYLGKRQGQGQ